MENCSGICYRYIPIVPIPILKQLVSVIYSFLYTLYWCIKNINERKIVVCSLMRIYQYPPVYFASRLFGCKQITIACDIPWMTIVQVKGGNLSNKMRFVIWISKKLCSLFDGYVLLTETMNNLRDHQSHAATDIRYIVLCFSLISGTLRLKEEHFKKLEQYATLTHDDERMRSIRPFIRASELGILCLEKTNSHYLHTFWENLSQITSCEAFMVQFPEEKRDISIYMEKLHSIFRYLADLFTASRCLDEKMIVLLGIATYSYKRFKECYEHNLFNSISGRSCVRVLIEDLILMKYLVKNEQKHENIWRDYQSYGIGLYKLVLARHRETNLQTNSQNESHFDMEYIEALVNEYRNEEFIDMDTRYFDNQNIRLKAKDVNEKNLYGLYYDYDSSYEHGLWGAIRESSLLMCNNPAHKYHGIPDVEDRIRLKTVMPDCIMVMNKILEFLDEIYGIPNDLKEEVMDFESQLINR